MCRSSLDVITVAECNFKFYHLWYLNNSYNRMHLWVPWGVILKNISRPLGSTGAGEKLGDMILFFASH